MTENATKTAAAVALPGRKRRKVAELRRVRAEELIVLAGMSSTAAARLLIAEGVCTGRVDSVARLLRADVQAVIRDTSEPEPIEVEKLDPLRTLAHRARLLRAYRRLMQIADQSEVSEANRTIFQYPNGAGGKSESVTKRSNVAVAVKAASEAARLADRIAELDAQIEESSVAVHREAERAPFQFVISNLTLEEMIELQLGGERYPSVSREAAALVAGTPSPLADDDPGGAN